MLLLLLLLLPILLLLLLLSALLLSTASAVIKLGVPPGGTPKELPANLDAPKCALFVAPDRRF